MKKLTNRSTKLFVQYIERVKDDREIEIPLPDRPALLIKRGIPARCDEGQGYFLSIGLIHNWEKKTYEYQMEFIVIDKRTHPKKYNQLIIYPISFRDDINRVTESSCLIINGTVEEVLSKFQKNQAAQAEQWLNELAISGYPGKAPVK